MITNMYEGRENNYYLCAPDHTQWVEGVEQHVEEKVV